MSNHNLVFDCSSAVFSGGKFGKLGHGDEAPKALPTRVMGELAELRVVQVSAGKAHTAALTDGGTVYIWGEKGFKLGRSELCGSDALLPTQVQGALENKIVSHVCAADSHTLFLTSEQEMYACGSGANDKLGLGDCDNRDTPTLVYISEPKVE